jgi:glycosyltransferase involved in cell wall biosynthesis
LINVLVHSSSMRVLVVSAVEPWRLEDGDSLILHHQLPLLAQRHDLSVIVAEGPAPETESDRELRSAYRPPSGTRMRTIPRPGSALWSAVSSRVRGFADREPARVHWVERPELVRAVQGELEAFEPELLYLFGWGTAALGRLAGPRPVVHAAVDAWELGVRNRRVSRLHRLFDVGQRRLVVQHERRHYPALQAVVVVTNADAEHVRSRTGGRVVVITNGVDAGPEPRPLAWEATPTPIVAFHGVFTTETNVDAAKHLVGAVLPRLRAAIPNVRILIIGRGSEHLDLPTDRSVERTGAVADVRPQLERAAVYVAPLVSGTGLKNKVLEAMAAGLPVVGSALALESIGAGGGAFLATDSDAMAATVARLLSEPGATGREGRAARQRVLEEFSWVRNVEQLTDLWTEVTGAPKS